jgi:uncharacterized protein
MKTILFYGALLGLALLALTQANFQWTFEPKNLLTPEEYSRFFHNTDLSSQEPLTLILSSKTEKNIPPHLIQDLQKALTALPEVDSVLHYESLLLIEIPASESLSLQESRHLMKTLERITQTILNNQDISFYFVGTIPTRIALYDVTEQDLYIVILPLVMVILLLPVLLYGSWRYVVLPGIVGIIALTLTFALYGLLGNNFTYFSLTLAPLLLCLSLLDVVFLVDRAHKVSHTQALRELWFPCTLTSLTTMMGFGALALFSDTPLLKEYGLFAALGILLALITTLTLVPALLKRWPHPSQTAQDKTTRVGVLIASMIRGAQTHTKKIVGLFILITLILLPFMSQVSVQSLPENIFPHDHPTQQGIDQLKKHFGSLTPMTLTLSSTIPDQSSRLRTIMFAHHLETWLNKLPFVHRTLSPISLTDIAKIKTRPGETLLARMQRVEQALENFSLDEIVKQSHGWVTQDAQGRIATIRLQVWPKDLSSEEADTFKHYLDNFNRTMMGEFRFTMSGSYFLKQMVESRFLNEAIRSLIFSGILVLLITLIPLKSFQLSLIFIIANSLPLLVVIGAMGLFKIPLSLALIGLPCILFGIVVDDTIHTLWTFKKTRDINETYRRKGRAILMTSLLLMVAFGGQVFSGILSNRELGGLAALGLFTALIVDLYLVPALLSLFKWPGRKSILPSP